MSLCPRSFLAVLVTLSLAGPAFAQSTDATVNPYRGPGTSPTGPVIPDENVIPPPEDACTPQVVYNYGLPSTRLVGAFYYPWYEHNSFYWNTCFSSYKPDNPEPSLGFYGSGDSYVVDAHMASLASHGVDVVGIEWAGIPSEVAPTLDPVIPSIASHGLKFVLLYDLDRRFGGVPVNFTQANVTSGFVDDFNDFVSNAKYFQHPSYLESARFSSRG